jgi:hypothetical protein
LPAIVRPTNSGAGSLPERGSSHVFLGTLVIVVTSEGLVRVDDRKSRGTRGDGESDSNKYEDFFHGRILSKGAV